MKKRLKVLFLFFGIILLCCAIMVGSAYLYLELSLKTAEADNSESNIPYAAPLPEGAGILLKLPDKSGYMLYLDFHTNSISVAQIESTETSTSNYFGYPVSYTVEADYFVIEGLIDRVGGLEILSDGEMLRHTGIQVLEKVHSTAENKKLKKELVLTFFKKIAETGFTKEDFVYIIKNSKTDLTVPDCFFWPPYLANMAKNTRFIN